MFLAALLKAHAARIHQDGPNVEDAERAPEAESKAHTSELNGGNPVAGTDIGGLA